MKLETLKDLESIRTHIETLELTIKKNEVYLNSKQIAEITGKSHKHVLEDIRDEEAKLKRHGDEKLLRNRKGEPIFRLSSYTNDQNKVQPMYILNRSGITQIMSRYSYFTRRLLTIRIELLDEMFQLNDEDERSVEDLCSLHFTLQPILFHIYDIYNGLRSTNDLPPDLADHLREEENRWSKIYNDEDKFIEWWESLQQHYRDTGVTGRYI